MSNHDLMVSLSPCFCNEFDEAPVVSRVFQVSLLLAIVSWNLWSMYFVHKNRKRIPLRQRAPIISIAHIFCSMMIMLLQLILELYIRMDWLSWAEAQNSCSEVPFSRRVFKFIHIFFRLGMTILAFLR